MSRHLRRRFAIASTLCSLASGASLAHPTPCEALDDGFLNELGFAPASRRESTESKAGMTVTVCGADTPGNRQTVTTFLLRQLPVDAPAAGSNARKLPQPYCKAAEQVAVISFMICPAILDDGIYLFTFGQASDQAPFDAERIVAALRMLSSRFPPRSPAPPQAPQTTCNGAQC